MSMSLVELTPQVTAESKSPTLTDKTKFKSCISKTHVRQQPHKTTEATLSQRICKTLSMVDAMGKWTVKVSLKQLKQSMKMTTK